MCEEMTGPRRAVLAFQGRQTEGRKYGAEADEIDLLADFSGAVSELMSL